MQQTENYLAQVHTRKTMHGRLRQALLILSLVVILAVFWGLKLTGITLAGEAFCGKTEHIHTADCENCALAEHIHDKTCYSNITLDLETAADWQAVTKTLCQSQNAAQRIVLVARSQLGYQESVQNFQVDAYGIRRGATRYGQWYGNLHGDWSAMFASFCLYYAGVTDLPVNAGPETMRLEWEAAGLYGDAGNFMPKVGHLLFLDKDKNGYADAVAVIVDITDDSIITIEGNVDNAVAETAYEKDGPAIMGYGLVPLEPQLQLLANNGARLVARTVTTDNAAFAAGDQLVIYRTDASGNYAVDGNGKLVPIQIDFAGNLYTDLQTPELLLWTVTDTGDGNQGFQNLVTQMYLPDNRDIGRYTPSAAQTAGSYLYAAAVNYTVWLDGTDGGLMSYGGSDNQRYTVVGGTYIQLPTTWRSPSEYNYTLRGWYDVTNNRYYAPGAQVQVNGYMVFYADWVASSYDIGQFNSYVANTVSTNQFVTTRMFDYGVLFNVLSASADVNVSSTGHSETWYLITNGNSPYSGNRTLDYIFRDWDSGGDISYPSGVTNPSPHYPTDAGSVYSGLYNDRIGTLLFDPDTQVIGKQYLGTADHLFQLCTDPGSEYYGYYYYDSERNAASYNQSEQRFYVYDYLEQTTVSSTTEGIGKYSDFLPLNSPYVNTNGNTPATYAYAGKDGEYAGVTHYMYDATNSNGSNVATNFFIGMSVDIRFYLPNTPGSGGNLDLYGKEMHFRFSGDDDVWVFVDDKLVLDLGGIHGMESGDINFSSGVVTINGVQNAALSNTLQSIQSGEHTLTLYYLERGSSMSNCAIYFNLAPRYSFSIQKEDVLTRQILNGAQFSVFLDADCTQPAQLWNSKEEYQNKAASTNVFTVVNGTANMWGLAAGETYYIKETKPPDAAGYGYANGIICISIDKEGVATYHVQVQPDAEGQLSTGFTVHGVKIDAQTQRAFIVATNAPSDMTEPTEVHVRKVWSDGASHAGEYITIYLTVTDPDGTVRRIREAVLSEENNWRYSWTNLPKTYADGTPVVYGVQEAVVPGYVGKVEVVEGFPADGAGGSDGGTGGITSVGGFENGGTYLLYTPYGYLAAADNKLQLESDQQTAQSANTALWVATINPDGTVTLTNKAGQTLYYENYAFRASSSPGQYKNLQFADNKLSCFIDHGGWSETQYPLDGDNVVNNIKYNHVLYSTNNSAQVLPITPQQIGGTQPEPDPEPTPEDGAFFQITNIPVGEAVTSLTVYKHWDPGSSGSAAMYEELTVMVRLLANGEDSGITGVLNLKNGWQYTFADLPIYDSEGNSITYTAEEIWFSNDWIPSYGDIVSSGGSLPTYWLTITNTFRTGGPELPATGTAARMLYILCGASIVLGSLVYGIVSRRKRERRMK